jgi:hypothetical protein
MDQREYISKTKQNKTKQNKTKQNKTKQNKRRKPQQFDKTQMYQPHPLFYNLSTLDTQGNNIQFFLLRSSSKWIRSI